MAGNSPHGCSRHILVVWFIGVNAGVLTPVQCLCRYWVVLLHFLSPLSTRTHQNVGLPHGKPRCSFPLNCSPLLQLSLSHRVTWAAETGTKRASQNLPETDLAFPTGLETRAVGSGFCTESEQTHLISYLIYFSS